MLSVYNHALMVQLQLRVLRARHPTTY
ncbi:protein of unknown function [Magnetospirillum sp. XM-1]|nr:protein of unknown function [Magnetospirillum sp. XM-1]